MLKSSGVYNLKWSIIFVCHFFFFKWVLDGDWHLQTFTFWLGWGCTFAREVCSCLLKITLKEDCNACATFFKGIVFGTLVTTDTCWLTQYWSWLWHLNICFWAAWIFSAYFVKKLDFAVATVKSSLKVEGFCDFCCNFLASFLWYFLRKLDIGVRLGVVLVTDFYPIFAWANGPKKDIWSIPWLYLYYCIYYT